MSAKQTHRKSSATENLMVHVEHMLHQLHSNKLSPESISLSLSLHLAPADSHCDNIIIISFAA